MFAMKDTIFANSNNGYAVNYDLKNFNLIKNNEAVSEVRSHFIDAIYKSLKDLDIKKLMLKRNETVKLLIEIKQGKAELIF